jgi:hypothetical protein
VTSKKKKIEVQDDRVQQKKLRLCIKRKGKNPKEA